MDGQSRPAGTLAPGWDAGSPAIFDAAAREQSLRRKTIRSAQSHQRARRSLPGGVASAVRRAARPYPLSFASGKGSTVCDIDGNQYLDYTLAWGPLILGHGHEEVVSAITEQAARALTFGAQHALEYEVAESLQEFVPCADAVLFANSGTEATQSALRLARAVTGRSKHLKFEGHYHGWDDGTLVSYHPTRDEIQASSGDPIGVALGQRAHDDVVVVEWNDFAAVRAAFAAANHDISSVICEPLLCNSGCIPPSPGFLAFLRDITASAGSLLIFDEVITGFRLGLGGAQGLYGVTPDLATYGKALGGGLPVSAIAGRAPVMDWVAQGKVLHAGTFNGNPLGLAAAKATLQVLARNGGEIFDQIWARGERLRQGIHDALSAAGLQVVTSGGGPVFHVAFMEAAPRNYRDLLAADSGRYQDFLLALLDEGILSLPDGRWYVSAAHSDEDITCTLAAVNRTVRSVRHAS